MSTKKDKFTLKDKFYMEIALDLAKSRHGLTGSNPSVGCVIVKKDEIISIGQTSFNGRPHAEFNALKSQKNFKNSDLYVTLEPCTHYGITPPCTNIIAKKGVKRVFFSFDDIDKRTTKRSKKILSKKMVIYSTRFQGLLIHKELVLDLLFRAVFLGLVSIVNWLRFLALEGGGDPGVTFTCLRFQLTNNPQENKWFANFPFIS